MKSFEENTLVFIIRIWPEPQEIESVSPKWRGVVENVFTGEKRYLKNLDELTAFIIAVCPEL
jgi:hypothetical protein